MSQQTPETIDEAKVYFTLIFSEDNSPTGKTRHTVNSEQVSDFYALAICKYENDSGYYLFYCNSEWDAITDTYHDTIERAKEQAGPGSSPG